MFGVQAADLRAFQEEGHYDGCAGLSPATVRLYDAVYRVCRRQPGQSRAFVHDDHDQSLEHDIESLAADIASDGRVCMAIQDTLQDLKQPSASFDPGHKDDLIMNVAQNIIRGRRLFPEQERLDLRGPALHLR